MPEKSLVTGHMNPDPCSLTAIFTCVRLQIERFEDGGWVVVLPYPDGGRNFDVPREFCPGETGWVAGENRRLLDGLAGGGW